MGCCPGEPLGEECPCPDLPQKDCCPGEECQGLSLGLPAWPRLARQELPARLLQVQQVLAPQEPERLEPPVLARQGLQRPEQELARRCLRLPEPPERPLARPWQTLP